MTNLSSLFKSLSALHNQSREPTLITIPQSYTFPFLTAYKEQVEVIDQMRGFENHQVGLGSHTGAGKSAVFLSLSRNTPTLIIEPRKYLQQQLSIGYFHDCILYGRSEYKCEYAVNASVAPCNSKTACDTQTHVPIECKGQPCQSAGHPCQVFKGKQMYKYPCKNCEYIKAQIEAKNVLRNNGTVICNFGNFWPLLKHAKLVVIDEADLFFREIAKPTRMYYSKKNDADLEIKELLQKEKLGLSKARSEASGQSAYALKNKLYDVEFLLTNVELCFKYQRKDRIYIEVNPENVSILKDKIFHDKKLIIVSATLGDFNIPVYSYSVWQRRGIFYSPVGKMTSTNLKQNPWLMGVAAERINTIADIAEGMFDTHKFPVHCGNIGTHATALNNLLGPDRKALFCQTCGEQVSEDIGHEEQDVKCEKCGRKWHVLEDRCTMHIKGNLMETIEGFALNDKRFLLVAGADYGGDMTWANVQFVLKYPYASLDERMRVLERVMGKEKFNRWYKNDARSRHIQQAGRVCRGWGDFGVTIQLDTKCREEYERDMQNYPEWYRSCYDMKVY